MPEELLTKLSKLGNQYDGIVQSMLANGAEPLQQQVQANLDAVVGKQTKYPSRSTGALQKSVKVTKAYQVKNGDWHIKVSIYGYDSKGVPNALKGLVIEKGRAGQPAKPWLKPAVSKSKNSCIQSMSETLDKEIKKL